MWLLGRTYEHVPSGSQPQRHRYGCGADGIYLYTLMLTDVATGWKECLPLLQQSQPAVLEAIDHARRPLPFPSLASLRIIAASSSDGPDMAFKILW